MKYLRFLCTSFIRNEVQASALAIKNQNPKHQPPISVLSGSPTGSYKTKKRMIGYQPEKQYGGIEPGNPKREKDCSRKVISKCNSVRARHILVQECRILVKEWSILVQECRIPVKEWSILVQECRIPVKEWSILVKEWRILVQEWSIPVQEWSIPVNSSG